MDVGFDAADFVDLNARRVDATPTKVVMNNGLNLRC
jgi:hypothetical protein